MTLQIYKNLTFDELSYLIRIEYPIAGIYLTKAQKEYVSLIGYKLSRFSLRNATDLITDLIDEYEQLEDWVLNIPYSSTILPKVWDEISTILTKNGYDSIYRSNTGRLRAQ